MRLSRLTGLACAVTALVVASRLSPAPALIDAATGSPFAGHLEFPLWHLLLTPFSSWADVITCSGARQDIALTLLVLLGFGAFRWFVLGHTRKKWFDAHDVLVALALYLPLTAGHLAWAVLWPHQPPRLVPDDPDAMAVDLHSHSSLSWDGRRSFTPEANAAWHEQAGFGASFLTDHNVFTPGASIGEEVSLHDSHIVVVGLSRFADRRDWTDDPDGVLRFLSDRRKSGDGLAVLSLPEYWQHSWAALDELADRASGIEIWTSSPKAMDFPASKRMLAVALARRKGLFLAGATDNHGYGSCACVWTVLKIPGWRMMDPRRREEAALASLRASPAATIVAARNRVEGARGDGVLLDPFRSLWLMLRTWTATQCLLALSWLWGLALVRPGHARRGK